MVQDLATVGVLFKEQKPWNPQEPARAAFLTQPQGAQGRKSEEKEQSMVRKPRTDIPAFGFLSLLYFCKEISSKAPAFYMKFL